MDKKNKAQDLRTYLEKGSVTIFTIYVVISSLGVLADLLTFYGVAKVIFYNNLSLISITIVSYLLYRFKVLSLKVSFAIVLYSAMANVFIGTFTDLYNPVRVNFFLRDSLFLMIVITLAALIIHKWHAIVMAVIYALATILIAVVGGNDFMLASLPMIILFVAVFALGMIYFVGAIDKAILERERNSQTIHEQNEIVKESNVLLKQRQEQIKRQSEELNMQAASLYEQAEKLAVKNNELEQLNLTKDKFISILAHDLKSPFNVILGLTEVLQEQFVTLKEEEKLECIKALNSTSRKTFTLLENLLQWAMSQSDSIKLNKTKSNITVLLKENLSLIRENVLNKSISIVDNVSEDYYSNIDVQMINTVIRNLLSNAMKFTPKGGEIKVSIEKNNDTILLEISDNGIGMDKKTQDNLFKIDKTRSRAGTSGEHGTGLGLLLCKDFIEKNGGEIGFTSRENEGTTFNFSIPAV